MAPKRNAAHTSSTPSSSTTTTAASAQPATSHKPSTSSSSSSTSATASSAPEILSHLWSSYLHTTPQRVKLLDLFMAFLVLVGGLQFLYCVIVGNYPFNAFLAGFSATVGQFVLTAGLRIQTHEGNKREFRSVSHERYVF
ncbi:MAG: hypothetical protein LQ351_000589 [Letrouitia transgressa]|nr:MAG: hypothetical protein LQ351_000589 [Letrouitia transgressa]